ncbi:MAG: hypothetical protein RIQ56_367 [Candidatus Parcubacteria bacterium]
MIKVTEEDGKGIAVDPNGAFPIEGSKCIRSIDVLPLCKSARAPDPRSLDASKRYGDLVCITYGTIKHPETGAEQKCIRIVWFIGSNGEKCIHGYPEAMTLNALKSFFTGERGEMLGCDPQAMAEAIAEHQPW